MKFLDFSVEHGPKNELEYKVRYRRILTSAIIWFSLSLCVIFGIRGILLDKNVAGYGILFCGIGMLSLFVKTSKKQTIDKQKRLLDNCLRLGLLMLIAYLLHATAVENDFSRIISLLIIPSVLFYSVDTAREGLIWASVLLLLMIGQLLFLDFQVTPEIFTDLKLRIVLLFILLIIIAAISSHISKNALKSLFDRETSLKESEKNLLHTNEQLQAEIAERRQVEEALRNSEQRMSDIIDFLPDPTWVIDRQGRVVAWNRALEKLTGVKAEDMLNKGNYEYALPFYGERRPLLLDLVTGKDTGWEDRYLYIKKEQDHLAFSESFHPLLGENGMYLSGSAAPLYDSAGNQVGAIESLRDITGKKQAEEALRQNEAFIKTILRTAPIGIGLVHDRVLSWVNDEFCKMVGYKRDELIGKSARILFDGNEEYERVGREKYGTIQEKGFGEAGARYRHKSGRMIDVQLRSTPIDPEDLSKGVIFTAIEITRIKRVESALRQSEKHLKALSNQTEQLSLAAADMISMKDEGDIFEEITRAIVENSDYRRVLISLFKDNPPYREIIGFGGIDEETIDQLRNIELSKDWYNGVFEMGEKIGHFSYYIPHTMKHILKQDATVFGTGPTPKNDDSWHPEDNLFVRMIDDRGDFIGVISVDESKSGKKPSAETVRPLEIFSSLISQIILFKREQKERKKLERQLLQTRKLESIGTLAGGIAHDFNNLLMGIQGRTSLMAMDMDSYHPHYEHLKGIEDYIRSATNLTKQLLGFARGGKYEVKATDLNRLIEKNLEMFGRTKKEISIHTQYKRDLWAVEIDRGQVEQVLLNLFVNAWQSMPGGGDLYVETANLSLQEKDAEAYQLEPGDYVEIHVTDTGIGMDQVTLERIFEPFFTTKNMGRGTGLGLASAYGIIKNHEGMIHVQSKKGHGTRFSIYIPASDKDVPIDPKSNDEIVKGHGAVLLVDDEHIVIDVGRQMLMNLGYEVHTARSGPEALEIYQQNHDRIQLTILDMIMPKMGGGEVFDRLRQINPEARVLLSSGYSMDGGAREILTRGCNGFIQKPFDLKSLSKKVRKILDNP